MLNNVNLDEYRSCVGMCMFNANGQVFFGARYFPNSLHRLSWQWPQGGIDPGESAEQAMYRELKEEIGVDPQSIEIISKIDDWLYYDIPDKVRSKSGKHKWRGQKQIWFALRYLGDDEGIALDQGPEIEFTHWRWGNLTEGPSLVVDFKREVYESVVLAFSPLI